MVGNIGFALLLSTLAGLSTTIGSVLGIAVRKPGPKFMTLTLGFSAGVMIHVSFVELLQGGVESAGFMPAHVAFFVGMAVMFAIDALIPHDYLGQEEHSGVGMRSSSLMKTGLLVALGIAIAVAVAIHNIPEGLAVAAPIYAATGSRKRAFFYSFLSGVAEPIGAGFAALILLPLLSDAILGYLLAGVGGIMVFIALDELIPVARSFGHEHLAISGAIIGMVVMTVSLWLL